jgi:hypothetical protein
VKEGRIDEKSLEVVEVIEFLDLGFLATSMASRADAPEAKAVSRSFCCCLLH